MSVRPQDDPCRGCSSAGAPGTAGSGPAPRGPILTTLQDFYKMGPGPSSSHTMGPMRITHDFFQRVSRLPEETLKRATSLEVRLHGSLAATGKGHGTDRAALAGLLGQSPAECPPEFLDALSRDPARFHRVVIGPATLEIGLDSIVFDRTEAKLPHPNTMTARLLAGQETLHEMEYYSVGGGFVEWKGYVPPDRGTPRHPYGKARDLKRLTTDDHLPLATILLENEMAISGRSERETWEFLDQVADVMLRGVEAGLRTEDVLPGPIKLHSKAASMQRRLRSTEKGEVGIAISRVASYGFAMSEENARGHVVVTAPTAGSAGILPALVRGLHDVGVPRQRVREGLLAAAAIGYLCKHNATLSGAEGGCQAEVGVGSAMAAALIAEALEERPQIVFNAAESTLEHHLGLTCDPVAGYVQIPCIERCAYGALKAWVAYCIASEECPEQRRIDLDTTIDAMALTARDMNAKYKETSEGGLAVSTVLC